MNRFRIPAIALFVVLAAPATASWGADSDWMSNRAWLRKRRAEIQETVVRDRSNRAVVYQRFVDRLLDIAEDNRVDGQLAEIQRLLSTLKRLNPDACPPLHDRLKKLPPAPDVADAKQAWYWHRKLDEARGEVVERPIRLLNQCLELRAFELAYQLSEEINEIDPDNASLRAQLGQVLYDGRWLTRHELRQARKGWTWDGKLGWIKEAERDRYERGEHFDRQASTWTTLEAANRAHSTVDNPWIVDTDHFRIRGTRKLHELIETATKLEIFYRRVIGVYGRFFEKGNGHGHLVLGTLEHPRLIVNVFRNRSQYSQTVPRAASWSAGVFHTAAKASFFYLGDATVRYHEVTHQILHLLTGANHSPPWLTEGAAVYCETAYFDDGRLVVGDIAKSTQTLKYVARFRDGHEMALDDLFGINSWDLWTNAKNPQPQYEAAGALVHFCMNGRNGQLRADFVDYLRDSYREATAGHRLWEYLGWDRAMFDALFEAWLEDISDQLDITVAAPTR